MIATHWFDRDKDPTLSELDTMRASTAAMKLELEEINARASLIMASLKKAERQISIADSKIGVNNAAIQKALIAADHMIESARCHANEISQPKTHLEWLLEMLGEHGHCGQ